VRCMYESCETSYGRGDGGYQCVKSAVLFCDNCGQPFCPDHIRPCKDCQKCFCSAPMESRCFGDHAHDPAKPPQFETMMECVERVAG